MGDILVATPLSLTNPAVITPISFLEKRSAFEREVVTRVIALIAASFFQALDLVLNFVMAIGKLPIAAVLEIKNAGKEHPNSDPELGFEGVAQHVLKVYRCIVGVLTASIGGFIMPAYLYKLCPLAAEVKWKNESSHVPIDQHINHGFMLNLASRPEKKRECQKHLDQLEVKKIKPFEGVNGKDSEAVYQALEEIGVAAKSESKEENIRFHNDFLKRIEGRSDDHCRGRLGCYLSHLLMLKRSYELCQSKEDDLNAFIIEDDCRFKNGAAEQFDKLMANRPEDWDIFFLGGRHDISANDAYYDDEKTKINPYIKRINRSVLLHAFMVNGKNRGEVYLMLIDFLKEALLRATETNKLQPVDDMIAYLQSEKAREKAPEWVKEWVEQRRQLNCYCPQRWLALQNPGFSDIEGVAVPTSKDKD